MKISITENNIRFAGDMTLASIPALERTIFPWLKKQRPQTLTLDLAQVENIDSSGVALIETLSQYANEHNINIEIEQESEHVKNARQTYSIPGGRASQRPKPNFFEAIGSQTLALRQNAINLLYMISDTFYFAVGNLVSRKGIRKGEFTSQCILIGMNAFPIVALISFLIGFILALQSAAQLRQFGASIYVADLISISMTREMGPIMTAILFAGRSGSSIAAELATMVVTEETDALKSMGLNPIRYNLIPKFHAITVMMPLLTILSMLIGIMGALLIGVTYLDIGIMPFYNQVVNALVLKDIITGLIKSVVFAWLIILTAAAYGLHARGGAADVGRATTASVVTSIFLVILADSLLGLLFYFDTGSPI